MYLFSKRNCVIAALMGSLALVGCGSSGGDEFYPTPAVLDEAADAARASVKPVLDNSNVILNGPASARFAIGETESLNLDAISDTVNNALNVGNFMRMVIGIGGGNINGGLFMGRDNDEKSSGFSVAKYENGVYERTSYARDYDSAKQGFGEPYVVANYRVEGCNAKLDGNGNLISLSISNGAKFTTSQNKYKKLWISDYNYETGYSYKIYGEHEYDFVTEGTFNGGVTVTWDSTVKDLKDPIILNWEGEDITSTTDEFAYGYQVTKQSITTVKTTISSNLSLNITKMIQTNYLGERKKYEGNANVKISGISGSIIDNRVVYPGAKYASKYNGEWRISDYVRDDFEPDNEEDFSGLSFNAPVKIEINGLAQEGTQTANIENVSVIINKLKKPADDNIEHYKVEDAEAHVNLNGRHNYAIKVGNEEIMITSAKIDITGLKYDHALRDEDEVRGNSGLNSALARYCAGNAIVHLETTESNNRVDVVADVDVAEKTATVKLTNNGNRIVTDEDGLTQFNFKTADINATNVDIFTISDDNKCNGAILEVNALEKDGLTTKRTYVVENNKLVLKSKYDKKNANLPEVKIDNKQISEAGLPQDAKSVDSVVANSTLKEVESANPETTVMIGNGLDGSSQRCAKLEKKANGKEKAVKTNAVANKGIIVAVSVVGYNEFTVVFAVKGKEIKGSVFKGLVKNVNIDSADSKVASFACNDGITMTVITEKGSQKVSLQ